MNKILLILLVAASFVFVAGQTKKNRGERPPVSKPSVVAEPTPDPKAAPAGKRNERPGANTATTIDAKAAASSATHFYEFTRPGFTYGRIVIEHNDEGKGKISFLKDGNDEMITDPIELSAVTMTRIGETLAEMHFLDSDDDYQFARDYSHMGNMSFTLNRGGRSRSVKYNWTEHKAAKALMDEYRRIANEYTWRFEILLARQNFPLQTPGLMEAIDSYFKRNEISDPAHLVPFLTELSNDERLPLIARNRATKTIKDIGKTRK